MQSKEFILLIENYFNQVQNIIITSEFVESYQIDSEKRGLYEGFIRGIIKFKDNSLLPERGTSELKGR